MTEIATISVEGRRVTFSVKTGETGGVFSRLIGEPIVAHRHFENVLRHLELVIREALGEPCSATTPSPSAKNGSRAGTRTRSSNGSRVSADRCHTRESRPGSATRPSMQATARTCSGKIRSGTGGLVGKKRRPFPTCGRRRMRPGEPTIQDWGDVIATLIIGVLGIYCVVAAVVGSEHPMLIRLVTATVGVGEKAHVTRGDPTDHE